MRQRLGVDLVFRIINTAVRTMDELGLPEHLKLGGGEVGASLGSAGDGVVFLITREELMSAAM